MAKTLDEILTDVENYPDNLTIKIHDNDVPLGSLRTFNKSERDKLISEQSAAKASREAAEKERTAALALSEQAAKIQRDLEARIAADPRGNNPTQDQFDTDPWYEPIRKRMAKYDEAVKKLDDATQRMENMQKNMSMTWAQDRWDNQYRTISGSMTDRNRKGKDDLLKYAAENKLVDSYGIPSVTMAWDKLTEADRMAEATEKARKEGEERGRQAAFAARVRPPSSGRPGKTPVELNDWNDLTDVAMQDEEIAKMITSGNLGVQ